MRASSSTRRTSSFSAAACSKRDAVELLGEHLGGFVSEDKALVREAINRGQPLSAGKSSNRLARELASRIAPTANGRRNVGRSAASR